MLNLKNRSTEKELLDGNNIPYLDIIQNMKELNKINFYLGGHQITINGFKSLVNNNKKLSIVEIGCGGGDNLKAIKAFCNHNNIEIEMIGIDFNFDITNFAKEQNKHLKVINSDYKQVKFKTKPDIIFSSLFCHHFNESQLEEQIIWMKENSKVGFFINDLERNWIAYYSIKLLTSIFSKSYLVKNDAPISVARGFKKIEWKAIFDSVNIKPNSIQWKWAFRHLIVFKHGK